MAASPPQEREEKCIQIWRTSRQTLTFHVRPHTSSLSILRIIRQICLCAENGSSSWNSEKHVRHTLAFDTQRGNNQINTNCGGGDSSFPPPPFSLSNVGGSEEERGNWEERERFAKDGCAKIEIKHLILLGCQYHFLALAIIWEDQQYGLAKYAPPPPNHWLPWMFH